MRHTTKQLISWALAASVFGFIFWVALPKNAYPHSWYDGWCCNGNGTSGDCQPIPASSVKPVEGGWQVTLRPGDHHMVTKMHTYFMPYSKARISQDDDYHACLFPDENTLRCLYVRPMAF